MTSAGQWEYMESLQPIDIYKACKERALQQESNLEAARKKDRKHTNNPSSGRNPSLKSSNNAATATTATPTAATAKERKPRATQGLVPQAERDRRMAAGDCLKCGKSGHIAKDCRTGWRYDPAVAAPTTTPDIAPAPEIQAIEGPKQGGKRKRNGQANDSGKD